MNPLGLLVNCLAALGRFFVWTPLLAWALPLLRICLLVSPLLAAAATMEHDQTVALLMVMAIWSYVMGQALVLQPRERTEAGVTVDMVTHVLVAIKTLQVLHFADARSMSTWLAPTLLALLYALLLHLDAERNSREEDELDDFYKDATTPLLAVPFSTALSLVLTLVASGLATTFAGADGGTPSTHGVLVLIEMLLGCGLVYCMTELRTGVDTLLPWLLFQACTLPLYADSVDTELAFAIQLMALAGVFMQAMSAASVGRGGGACAVCVRIWDTIETITGLVRLVLGSAIVYQIVVIVCLAVLTSTMNESWYTTHAMFPKPLRRICDLGLDFIDTVIRVIYEFTTDESVQRILLLAAPQVGMVRATVYRTLQPSYKWIVMGAEGVRHDMVPTKNLLALVAFCIGPVLAALGSVVQVFEDGVVFARSRWFWAAACFGSLLFCFVTQLTAGAPVTLISFVFQDSEYTRVYSDAGQYALMAQGVLIAACLALFLVRSQPASAEEEREEDAEEQRDERQRLITEFGRERQGRVGARPATLVNQVAPSSSVFASAPPARESKNDEGIASSVTRFLTAPSLLLTVTAVFFILMVTVGAGSPIKTFDVKKVPLDTPKWLVSTTIDKAGSFASSIINILIDAFGPEARLALIFVAMIDLLQKKLGCFACFCVELPDPDDLNPMNWGRRRLLAIAPDVGFNETLLDPVVTLFADYQRDGATFDLPPPLLPIHVPPPSSSALAVVPPLTSPLNGTRDAYDFGGASTHARRLLGSIDWTFDAENPCSGKGEGSCSGVSVCVSDIFKIVAPFARIIEQLVMVGLTHAVKFVIKNILNKIPVISLVDKMFSQFHGLDAFIGFGLFDMPDFASFSFNFKLFGLDLGILPNFRLPAVRSPDLGTLVLLLVAVALIAFVAWRLGVLKPLASTAFAGITMACILAVVSFAISVCILAYLLVAELRVYGYDVIITLSDQAYLYFIPAFLLLLAAFLKIGEASALELRNRRARRKARLDEKRIKRPSPQHQQQVSARAARPGGKPLLIQML